MRDIFFWRRIQYGRLAAILDFTLRSISKGLEQTTSSFTTSSFIHRLIRNFTDTYYMVKSYAWHILFWRCIQDGRLAAILDFTLRSIKIYEAKYFHIIFWLVQNITFCILPIFSSPEHKVLMVSFCHRSVSVVVRRASSTIALNDISSWTAWRILMKLHRNDRWVTLNCPNRSAPLHKMVARAINRKNL